MLRGALQLVGRLEGCGVDAMAGVGGGSRNVVLPCRGLTVVWELCGWLYLGGGVRGV